MTDRDSTLNLITKIDPAALQGAINGLKRLSDEVDKLKGETKAVGTEAEKVSRTTEQASRAQVASIDKVTNSYKQLDTTLGNVIKKSIDVGAKLAIGITGTAVASSVAFTQRFEGVDAQANAQGKAQREVVQSFAELGRITSRLVTPALETLADVVTIVAAGLDQLIPKTEDNPFETFFTTTIPDAIKTVQDLGNVFKGLIAIVERDLGNALDTFATNIKTAAISVQQGLATVFNGLIDIIASAIESFDPTGAANLRNSKDSSAFVGPRKGGIMSAYDEQIRAEQAGLIDRVAGRNTRASNTGKELAESGAEIARANTALKETIKTVFDAAGTFREQQNLITREAVDAFITRNKELAQAEKQADDNEKKINDNYDRLKLDATKKFNEALLEQQQEQFEAEQKLNDDHQTERSKRVSDFNDESLRIEQDYQRKREQDLARHELRLRDLAGAGDVAGFVEEQRQFKLDRQQEQSNYVAEERQRNDAFAKELNDLDQQYSDQLSQLQQAGAEKQSELQKQYDEQLAQFVQARDEQLNAVRDNLTEQRNLIEQNFAEQLASLDNNLFGLRDMQEQYYLEQSDALRNFIETQKGYYQDLYASVLSTASYGGSVGGGASGVDAFGQMHQGGLWSVPYSGYKATLHEGETVLSSLEAGAYRAARMNGNTATSGVPNVTVNNTVGDIATKSMLDEYQETTIAGIQQGYRDAMGRG